MSVAAAGGLLHLVVMVWFARRLGVTITGGYEWVLYASSTVGMWLLAAVPLYLLVRHRLVVPATLLTGFIVIDVRSEFAASVEDAHALYFGAWFVFLAIFLIGGLVEYGLRQVDSLRRMVSRRGNRH
ncbi:hypothetical protein SY89_00011 [Halolamina pelagica]|uniref:Uncharacterized protein n=1 Tax=Halolamina pelagica TaxID=699431 RepID=A0A0P7H7F3_9EURY|nr:hypothetical protein [Halolamina pelagica]KPN29298.1 hypothetical protein SY89_00011 [Halolamina pelagica]